MSLSEDVAAELSSVADDMNTIQQHVSYIDGVEFSFGLKRNDNADDHVRKTVGLTVVERNDLKDEVARRVRRMKTNLDALNAKVQAT